ncbi:MAG: ABC transporter permease subunit [Chloroflexota bacterium]|nr:ABC transporter permease subunit [Chloroflexota bacterium]
MLEQQVESPFFPDAEYTERPRKGIDFSSYNRPLLLGMGIILFVLILAWAGPSLAPRDPMELNRTMRVGDQWISPPFPPFTVPGFPLGSDEVGRDVLSRLLWAIRPTLTLVIATAALRLLLGTFLGISAGWSRGKGRQLLDALTASALAVPVLIVALAVIAATGIEMGIWAFVLGLTLTGWAETAAVVREQTRVIKGQAYIEASRALGASDAGIMGRHILRQIMPLLGMLFAFEISGTLVIVAALGFLGYYLSGEMWLAISDTVAQRYTGEPELGQMLSGTLGTLYQGPWSAVAAGIVVFVIVLGFNLLAEGLQIRLNSGAARPSFFGRMASHLRYWIEEKIEHPLYTRYGTRPVRLALASAAALGLFMAGYWWQASDRATAEAILPAPGGHLWAAERRDPYGTLWTSAVGPNKPEVRFRFTDDSGFSGGPAIAQDGTLYIASRRNTLYAIDPKQADDAETGEPSVRWQMELPELPVGSPALDAEGRIYLADDSGGLSAISTTGDLLWTFQPSNSLPASAGPVIAPDGRIFYPIGGAIQALSSEGEPLWHEQLLDAPVFRPPHLSPDSSLLFWGKRIVSAESGAAPVERVPTGVDYTVGADGNLYVRTEHFTGAVPLSQWTFLDGEMVPVRTIFWSAGRRLVSRPREIGVTPSVVIWLAYYSNRLEDAKIGWTDAGGHALGIANFPHRPTRPIAMDRNSILYTCGMNRGTGAECLAFRAGSEQPTWQLPLSGAGEIIGGALADGQLYVATENGVLFIIGEA